MGMDQATVEVLQHMAKGHILFLTLTPSACWLDGVPGDQGDVQGTTLHALVAYKWIRRADTDATLDWQDYVITQAGRLALTEEETRIDAAQRDEARRMEEC